VSRTGSDVVVVLDTSLSMAAADVSPNRLELARHSAVSLVRRLAGNRISLVTFAGKATVACPLTLDSEAVLLFLDSVDLEAVPVPGTALAEALDRTAELFQPGPAAAAGGRGRAVVLFTDGEDHEEGLDDAVENLKRTGVPVYAVGIGTARGGPIPLGNGSDPTAGYKKDREGRVVTTRLSEEVLEKVGLGTGGRYYRSTPAELEIDEIVEAISGMDATEFGNVLRMRYEERFQVPLGLALLAILAEILISDRRKHVPASTEGVES
jgi:Ca-activated chloride channel family protein